MGGFNSKNKIHVINYDISDQEEESHILKCDICLGNITNNKLILDCGHILHKRCLHKHLLYKHPNGFSSLQIHTIKLGCPICHTPLSNKYDKYLTKYKNDIKLMLKAMNNYIEVEYPENERQEQLQKLIYSTNSHYYWCKKCHTPQFIPKKASCSEIMENNRSIPCSTCNPKKFFHTCPQCEGVLYVNHGCNQIRHCIYGERCGLNNTKKKTISGVEWHIPDPVSCDHGGGCGCIFNINPRPRDLREIGIDLKYTKKQLKNILIKIHGQPYLLLEYYTRHDPKCKCPGCNKQPYFPEPFNKLFKDQVLKLYEISTQN